MALGTRAYLSIGSNKGETGRNLDLAIEALGRVKEISLKAVSRRYKTAPQNYQDQDWFLNAALEIDTCLSPDELLDCLKRIETELDSDGKAFRFGPRIIDLDIVLYGDQIFRSDALVIPHPRMHERAFVLKPLCDLDEGILHPEFEKSVKDLLNDINTQENQEVIPLDQEA